MRVTNDITILVRHDRYLSSQLRGVSTFFDSDQADLNRHTKTSIEVVGGRVSLTSARLLSCGFDGVET
jgi:uncharacterized protein (DUF779 family)